MLEKLLADVLGTEGGPYSGAVPGVPRLQAMSLDHDGAAAAYCECVIG
ncbi:MAG TPA: hypothetical protein VIC05_12485 [Solirubrobacteraceae bacterium]|jgi:hypothetical protein